MYFNVINLELTLKYENFYGMMLMFLSSTQSGNSMKSKCVQMTEPVIEYALLNANTFHMVGKFIPEFNLRKRSKSRLFLFMHLYFYFKSC